MAGRPSARGPRQAAVLAHVVAGSSRRAAAALAGVPFSTFYEWCESPKFAERLARAEAEFERIAIERIDAAGRRGSWRAQLSLLERRLPNDWQQRQRIELEGDIGGDVTAEERALLRRMREQAERSIDEQRAELRDLLLLTLEDAADDGDTEFVRTFHERTERLLERAALTSAT